MKMYRIVNPIAYILTIILISLSNNAYCDNEVSFGMSKEISSDFLRIKIKGLEVNLQRITPSSDYFSVRFPETAIGSFINNDGFMAEKLVFTIAVPKSGELEVDFRYQSIKPLGKHSLAIADSNKFLNSDNNQRMEAYAKIKRIGSRRGISLAEVSLQPFIYDNFNGNLEMIDDVELTIHFENPISKEKIETSPKEAIFFQNIFNKEQLPYLLYENQRLNRNTEPVLEDYWYNPQTTYYRASTTKDGIASLFAKDLLAIAPELDGQKTQGLRLVFQGQEYPFYAQDSDGKIDASDRYFFYGRRAEGDTTWFDNFTNEAVFYFYYDNSKAGKRLSDFQESQNPQSETSNVNVRLHIEKDSIYTFGNFDYQLGVDPVVAEGWYWKELNPKNIPNFFYNLKLTPTDTLHLRIPYQSKEFSRDVQYLPPHHKFALIINSDTISIKQFDFLKNGEFLVDVPANKLGNGANEIKIVSLGRYNDKGVLYEIDYALLDYIEANGKVEPNVFNSSGEFYVGKQSDETKLEINGFGNPQSFLLDLKNSCFKINDNSQTGTRVLCSSKKGQYPYADIVINDSVLLFGNKTGLHIGILRSPDFIVYEYRYFDSVAADINSFVSSVPDGSILAIAYNGNSLSQPAKNVISSLGGKQASDNKAYAFSVIKGQPSLAIENAADNGFAKLSTFFYHKGGTLYSTLLNLEKNKEYHLLTADVKAIENVKLTKTLSSDLRNTSNKADYIIITHNKFKAQAEEIADYRRKTRNLITKIVDIDDVYKEFYFGKKSAHSIKAFLKYAYHNWQKPAPQYVLLLGDANWDCRHLTPNSVNVDYIPTYGWPVTDYWYCLLDTDNEQDFNPDIFIGRIPAQTIEQAENHIANFKEYEKQPYRPWNKSELFLSGGLDKSEIVIFSSLGYLLTDEPLYSLANPPFCGSPSKIIKQDPNDFNKDGGIIKQAINKGSMWTNYLGHGSVTTLGMDGWNVDRLNNKGKLGFLTTISCNTGAFAQPDVISRNEEYIFELGKGFIASAGSSSGGPVDVNKFLILDMFKNVSDSTICMRTLSQITAISRGKLGSEKYLRDIAYQFNLLGEPLIELKIAKKTELYFYDSEISFLNEKGLNFYTEDDSIIRISGIIYNAGYSTNKTFIVRLVREFEGKKDSMDITLNGICLSQPFDFTINIKNMPGEHRLSMIIDPDNRVTEETKDNNVFSKTIEVFAKGISPLEPLSFWNVDERPVFRFIKTQEQDEDNKINLSISQEESDGYHLFYENKSVEIFENKNFFDWRPAITLSNDKFYKLSGWLSDKSGSNRSKEINIPFHISPVKQDSVRCLLSGKSQLLSNKIEHFYYDNQINALSIFNDTISCYISASGGRVVDGMNEIDRFSDIVLGDSSVQSDALFGAKILRMSKTDSTDFVYRYYNTWDDDSSSIKCLQFLADSVSSDYYLVFAVCGPFYREFILNEESNNGYSKLNELLNGFGAGLANDFTRQMESVEKGQQARGWGLSYAAVLDVGNGVIAEIIDSTGDFVTISAVFSIYNKKAMITTDLIGPAKSYDKFHIDADLPENSSLNIDIYGYKNIQDKIPEKLATSNELNVNLHNINANEFPFLNAEVSINRTNLLVAPAVKSLEFRFAPSAELCIDSISENSSGNVLRGDTVNIVVNWQNLAYRASLDSSKSAFSVNVSGNEEITGNEKLTKTAASVSTSYSLKIPTRTLGANNVLRIILNPEVKPAEQYLFNNTTEIAFKLREDTIPPYIVLKADGTIISNGDYIGIRPMLVAELYDNSRLDMKNPDNLELWVDAKVYKLSNSEYYKFDTIVDAHPLKATLTLLPDSLSIEDRQHWIRVIGIDASGNKITKDYDVFLPAGASIKIRNSYPNPFSERIIIEFQYRALEANGDAIIDIFDLNGRQVNSIKSSLKVGTNVMEWDGRDHEGRSIPSGIYFYRISTKASYFAEPAFGKCIFVK